MNKGINIILVDDNIPFRTNLKNYLEQELGCSIIAEASNGLELLSLPGYYKANIILMDLLMNEMDGYEATQRILWQNFSLKIIAITFHGEVAHLDHLLEIGFKGCVFKTELYNQLPKAIETVMKGQLYFPENLIFE